VKIFVLGAGRMGSAVVQDLVHTARDDLEIGIGDVDLSRAQGLTKAGTDNFGQAYKVDVLDTDTLSSILERYDAVVNATWYENNVHVMKACLRAGCNYNDLGGLFHVTRKQLLLDSEFGTRGISAVVGGGESPGMTNVMCAMAAEEMTSVESVKVYAGARETGATQGLVFPFAISTVIDEYTKKPVEYLNGTFVELPALSGGEEVVFPEPVGRNVCHYSIHSEPATLPTSLGRGVRSVEFRLGISEKMVRALSPLIEVGMLSDERKIPVNGVLVPPRDFVVSFFNATSQNGEQLERWVALRALVSGISSDGRRSRVSCDLVSAPGSYGFKNATAYLTGVAGSMFGQYLARGKIASGVNPPELALDSSTFVKELDSRAIKITKKVEYLE
jgi:lysine 6-dehydrogenase